ncbi:hypothetical protein [Humibacter sp.]|uniref:hypothetical protein n=1 Tax=Humibacter sp. TaxID=1940291 RepID=UPI003F7F37E9
MGFQSPYMSYGYSPAPPTYGMPPMNPGAFQQAPLAKMGGSSVFSPSSAMFQQAPAYAQFNMGGPLSEGSAAPSMDKSVDETPWYKNPAILNTIAGAGSAILQNNQAAAQRHQEQQRIDLQRQAYEDQHKRAQATSEALNPIIARLLGQMMPPQKAQG